MVEPKPFIVGNWKMHKTIAETRSTLSELRVALQGAAAVEIGVAPPVPSLAAAAEVVAGSPIQVVAQNMHHAEEGAFTGEVSPRMLVDVSVRYVILGHSERRALFAEDDELIAVKVRAAIAHGLAPILCVGESLQQRQSDETMAVVTAQLAGAVEGLRGPASTSLVIAYEPVWAIGTGLTATPEQAQQVHAGIRACLSDLLGAGVAAAVRIQYGGSVKPGNAAGLLAQPDIDGALVGGASLEPESFAAIVAASGGKKAGAEGEG
ncbi:MAG: triose-phosphate isomerase [Acidobacteriota bacterium]